MLGQKVEQNLVYSPFVGGKSCYLLYWTEGGGDVFS